MRKLSFALALGAACVAALGLAVTSSRATYRGSNGLLAYQAKVGKHFQLFTIKPNGTGARQITHLTDSDAISAVWSPDGRRIAFARDFAVGTSGEHLDIVVVNANGTGMHPMGLHGLNGDPAWSPDGRHILWARPAGLAVANPDGSGLRQLKVAGGPASPVYSPDGKQIAFWKGDAQGSSIDIVNADGSGLRRVKAFAGGLGDKIDWSPDGTRIAFDTPSFGPPKSSNVFTMRTNGSGLRQLTHATGGTINNGLDSWSPDGKKIAFVNTATGIGVIYVMNADGTGVKQLTHGPDSHRAAWGTHP